MTWRYLAERLTGEGKGVFLDLDLPLQDVSLTDVLSGPTALNATVQPEILALLGPDGRPLLDEWSTAIYAEKDGEIRGGGILTKSQFEGEKWSLDCMGFAGYPQGMPYTDATFFVQEDPANIFRHIWQHLQSKPGGNLGLVVDGTKTPVRIGTKLTNVAFTPSTGPNAGQPVAFEAGPYKLAWYQTDDLGRALDDLAAQTPFEYHEEHAWSADGGISHFLRIGYPTIGKRRTDLRFAFGENVSAVPQVERDGDDYANEILALGAGEGRDMLRGGDSRKDGRLRRVQVVADKTARSKRAIQSVARSELARRAPVDALSEITVFDHPNAPLGSWRVGDEVLVQGDTGWVEVEAWCRVLSTTISPDSPSVASLAIARSDTLAA